MTSPALAAGYPLGLAAVTSIGGGVRLDFDGVVNFNVQGLAGVTSVPGDVVVEGGGDLIILGAAFQGPLVSVGGTMRLDGCSTSGSVLWPALASVGGSLELIEYAPPALSDIGSTSLVLGGLVVDATGIQQMDAAHVSVQGAGEIAITDNPQLDTCGVESFVATPQAAGWSGMATIAGNGGASCP